MKSKAFEKLAENVIKNLEKRNMEGYYFEDSKSCVSAIMNMMPEESVVSWGGSMTLTETGMMDALKASDLTLIDRATAKTPQENREIFAKTLDKREGMWYHKSTSSRMLTCIQTFSP